MSFIVNMDRENTICREVYGFSSVANKYIKDENGKLVQVNQSPKWTSISTFFRSVFLPQGYPESVSSDYLTYQIWDTIQAFASSITGTLAAQAVLKGVGVGDENATVLAATITWLLKDGTGMIGRIAFAWIRGSSLDYDAKRWRLFADILNDLAIFVEIVAPNFPHLFTPIVCFAGVCKSIVGVAGGATRAALTQHQARRNNMADVSAKDGSQETLVNLAALLCSMTLVPIVTGNDVLIWTLFILFTSLHLFANYSAVTCVVMETLNQARLHILVQKHLQTREVLTLPKVNYMEPVLWKTRRKLDIYLGSSVQRLVFSVEDMEKLLLLYRSHAKYILNINLKRGEISIVLSKDCTENDQLMACYQAEIIRYVYTVMYKNQSLEKELEEIAQNLQSGDSLGAVEASFRYTRKNFSSFKSDITAVGWLIEPVLLGPDEWRCTWDKESLYDKKDL